MYKKMYMCLIHNKNTYKEKYKYRFTSYTDKYKYESK